MEQGFNADVLPIDAETWERRALFEFFGRFSDPYHGVCLRVDCTETFRAAKEQRISVFLALVHRSLLAAHQIENFRLRVVEGGVWRYATIHGGCAVGRANGTIGFAHFPFHADLAEFVRTAAAAVERVKSQDTLERFEGQNLIRYSVLPWLDFTSISHATDTARRDSAPKLTFGKITESGGRRTMPVSIHVHHGLVDGSHVAQFVEAFERYLDKPSLQG